LRLLKEFELSGCEVRSKPQNKHEQRKFTAVANKKFETTELTQI